MKKVIFLIIAIFSAVSAILYFILFKEHSYYLNRNLVKVSSVSTFCNAYYDINNYYPDTIADTELFNKCLINDKDINKVIYKKMNNREFIIFYIDESNSIMWYGKRGGNNMVFRLTVKPISRKGGA